MGAIQFMGGMDTTGALFRDVDTGMEAEGYEEYLSTNGIINTPAKVAITPTTTIIHSPANLSPVIETTKICKAETFNVIKLAKQRKKWLEGEIKRLRMLEKEHLELTRLLDAAGKPLAIVHEFKQAKSAKSK
jgi:hypothetical protein